MNKKKLVLVVLLAFFLAILVPLLINASYNMPFTIIQVEWEAEVVLDYYGTLLGIGATVATFLIGVGMTIEQIRYQQNYQETMKLWQETEDSVDHCLEVIHPQKLKYAVIDVVTKNESANALSLFSHVESYRVNAVISVDKLSASLTKAHSEELEKLVKEIETIRDGIVPIAEGYLASFSEVQRYNAEYVGNSEKLAEQKEHFQQQIEEMEQRLEVIYKKEYLRTAKNKETLFRNKYDEIAQQKPRIQIFGEMRKILGKKVCR